MATALLDSDTHYGALGLNQFASSADIKKAYRELALKLHPDKNPDGRTQEQFQRVASAYAVLSDGTAKSRYDLTLFARRSKPVHPYSAASSSATPQQQRPSSGYGGKAFAFPASSRPHTAGYQRTSTGGVAPHFPDYGDRAGGTSCDSAAGKQPSGTPASESTATRPQSARSAPHRSPLSGYTLSEAELEQLRKMKLRDETAERQSSEYHAFLRKETPNFRPSSATVRPSSSYSGPQPPPRAPTPSSRGGSFVGTPTHSTCSESNTGSSTSSKSSFVSEDTVQNVLDAIRRERDAIEKRESLRREQKEREETKQQQTQRPSTAQPRRSNVPSSAVPSPPATPNKKFSSGIRLRQTPTTTNNNNVTSSTLATNAGGTSGKEGDEEESSSTNNQQESGENSSRKREDTKPVSIESTGTTDPSKKVLTQTKPNREEPSKIPIVAKHNEGSPPPERSAPKPSIEKTQHEDLKTEPSPSATPQQVPVGQPLKEAEKDTTGTSKKCSTAGRAEKTIGTAKKVGFSLGESGGPQNGVKADEEPTPKIAGTLDEKQTHDISSKNSEPSAHQQQKPLLNNSWRTQTKNASPASAGTPRKATSLSTTASPSPSPRVLSAAASPLFFSTRTVAPPSTVPQQHGHGHGEAVPQEKSDHHGGVGVSNIGKAGRITVPSDDDITEMDPRQLKEMLDLLDHKARVARQALLVRNLGKQA